MAQHNDIGVKGENIACEFMRKKNYFILDRNWRFHKGELDIVATIGNLLVVAEVKTRQLQEHADPDDTISKKKLLQLYETTDRYMEIKNIPWEVRYDLITIIFHGDTWSIEHIEDAFYPFMNT